MATSYVEYNNFGFWSHDRYLSAILYLIQKHLTENEKSPFLEKIGIDLLDASTAGYIGSIPNYITEFSDAEKIICLKNSIVKSIEEVKNNTEKLISEFNKYEVGGFSWQTIPKKEITETAEMLLKLIAGEIKTNASSKIDYWTFA